MQRKYVRSGIIDTAVIAPIPFVDWESTCNWKDEASHCAAALRGAELNLSIDSAGESSLLSNLSSSEYCGGAPVVMYCLQVSRVSHSFSMFYDQ